MHLTRLSTPLRLLASVVGAIALLATPAFAASAGDSTYAKSNAPFTFHYPSSFKIAPYSGGKQLNSPSFAVALGITSQDYMLLQTYKLKFTVAADGSGTLNGQKISTKQVDAVVDASIRKLATSAGFTKQRPATTGKLGSLRARVYIVTKPDGSAGNHVTVALLGSTEYYLACQATPKKFDEVKAACNRVIATFAKR
jgi:hypothetical protein